jgi:hypothetical protein
MMVRKALLAACAAVGVAVAGCGTQHAGMATAAGTTVTRTTAVTAQSPEQRAAAEAASLLAAFRPPPGAARSGRLAVSSLAQAPDVPLSPDLVTRTEWYRVPGKWQAVFAWILAHPPGGLTLAGSGGVQVVRGAGGGLRIGPGSQAPCRFIAPPVPASGPSAACFGGWDVEFSRSPVPGVLAQGLLEISVAGDGNGRAAVRVDAVDIWIPAKPAGERIPVSAKVVTIAPVWGVGPVTAARPVTVTNPATVARIAAVIDDLPVFPPGTVMSCPMFQGRGMRLTFRASAGGPVLAVIQGDTSGCGTVSVTINGRSMPTLSDATAMQQQILAIAGAHWPGFPA